MPAKRTQRKIRNKRRKVGRKSRRVRRMKGAGLFDIGNKNDVNVVDGNERIIGTIDKSKIIEVTEEYIDKKQKSLGIITSTFLNDTKNTGFLTCSIEEQNRFTDFLKDNQICINNSTTLKQGQGDFQNKCFQENIKAKAQSQLPPTETVCTTFYKYDGDVRINYVESQFRSLDYTYDLYIKTLDTTGKDKIIDELKTLFNKFKFYIYNTSDLKLIK